MSFCGLLPASWLAFPSRWMSTPHWDHWGWEIPQWLRSLCLARLVEFKGFSVSNMFLHWWLRHLVFGSANFLNRKACLKYICMKLRVAFQPEEWSSCGLLVGSQIVFRKPSSNEYATALRQPPPSSGVVMDPLDPRECSGGHTEDRLLLASLQPLALREENTYEHVHPRHGEVNQRCRETFQL